MDFYSFIKDSGLKVLSLTDLSKVQNKVVFYLLHSSVSELNYLISNHHELASTLDSTQEDIDVALQDLVARNIVNVKYKYKKSQDLHKQPFRINMQYDLNKWLINDIKRTTSTEALVFPFRRSDGAALMLVESDKGSKVYKPHKDREESVQQVLEAYANGKSLSSKQLENALKAAEVLVDTHPIDQVTLMIKFFGDRIQSLSLLASSWQHFIDRLDEESHKIDIFDARIKQTEMNQCIQKAAMSWIERAEELGLKESEIDILKMLNKHTYPRRQLYWAYQARDRYPRLKPFFEEHQDLMLSVTNSGTVVKKKD